MQPSSDPINFPQAALDDSSLLMLYNFCKNGTPPLMMMVSEDSVTISLVDRAVVQYAWTPAQSHSWKPIGFGVRDDAQELKEQELEEEPEPEDNDK